MHRVIDYTGSMFAPTPFHTYTSTPDSIPQQVATKCPSPCAVFGFGCIKLLIFMLIMMALVNLGLRVMLDRIGKVLSMKTREVQILEKSIERKNYMIATYKLALERAPVATVVNTPTQL